MYKTFTRVYLSLILLIACCVAYANQITVCPSGCGYTSIQAAVNAASSGDTILVNVNGVHTESGISVTRNLVIRGLGQNTTIVQAHSVRSSAIHRVFYTNANVTIENLTIRNGRETDFAIMNGSGCGLLADGTSTITTLNNVTVENCENAAPGGAGAGITLAGSSTTLYLNNCTVQTNAAPGGSAGGLYLSANNGVCQARNTAFRSNTAASSGGAVFLGGTITASFINCTFSNNQAQGSGSGGAINSSSAIPTIYNCTFSGNSAGNQGGAIRIGGANITNCTFFENTAVNGGAISRGTSASSNALYIVNCTIARNIATGSAPVGAGLQNASSTAVIHMVNTVIANSLSGSDLYLNTASTLSTNQKNYVGSASFTTGSTTFAYSASANLASSLGSNGGLTSTLSTSAGSVLINNGTSSVAGISIPAKDQRNLPFSGSIDIGAYEYNATETMSVSYTTLSNTNSSSSRTLSVNISDNAGVPTSGSFQPRIYFRKNSGNWVSSQGTLSSGTAQSGTWNFTINHSLVGGVNNSDVISYFIVAQDNTTGAFGKSNLSGLVAGSVNAVTISPAAPPSYIYNGTLPIKLLSFEATKTTAGVELNWKTEEDGSAERYILMKSTDGNNFHPLADYHANKAGRYNHIDPSANATCYYQLKMVELSGAVLYSKVLAVRFEGMSKNITLQSNQITGDFLSVKFNNLRGQADYEIIDAAGHILSKGVLNAETSGYQTIFPGNLAKGWYYLRIRTGTQKRPVVFRFNKG